MNLLLFVLLINLLPEKIESIWLTTFQGADGAVPLKLKANLI